MALRSSGRARRALRDMRCLWWSRRESNPRPLECHSSTLPTELRPHRSADPNEVGRACQSCTSSVRHPIASTVRLLIRGGVVCCRRSPEWWNWYTQGTQNPPVARSCGFKSRLRHHLDPLRMTSHGLSGSFCSTTPRLGARAGDMGSEISCKSNVHRFAQTNSIAIAAT